MRLINVFILGTIVATLTRRKGANAVAEYIPKYEMITFSKSSSIPTSHIQMYDHENVNMACSVFRVSYL